MQVGTKLHFHEFLTMTGRSFWDIVGPSPESITPQILPIVAIELKFSMTVDSASVPQSPPVLVPREAWKLCKAVQTR